MDQKAMGRRSLYQNHDCHNVTLHWLHWVDGITPAHNPSTCPHGCDPMTMKPIDFALVFHAMYLVMSRPDAWVKYSSDDDTQDRKRMLTRALWYVSDYHDINLTFMSLDCCNYCCYVTNNSGPNVAAELMPDDWDGTPSPKARAA